jgi:hypothetical protein
MPNVVPCACGCVHVGISGELGVLLRLAATKEAINALFYHIRAIFLLFCLRALSPFPYKAHPPNSTTKAPFSRHAPHSLLPHSGGRPAFTCPWLGRAASFLGAGASYCSQSEALQ